jgi:hypothetical protein
MIAWLMIACLVGGMTWLFAVIMYSVLMWSRNRQTGGQ